MLRREPRPRARFAAIAVALLFLATAVAGAFPFSGPCGGDAACVCCAESGGECSCPPDSSCGCRDGVKSHAEEGPLPTVGLPATLVEGVPTLAAPDAGRAGTPVRPGPAKSRLPVPETPPPRD